MLEISCVMCYDCIIGNTKRKRSDRMKLLVVRHGEPNYEKDCLTENGRTQAQKLGERLNDVDIAAAYASSMGRASETARIALDGRGLKITACDWLRELNVGVHDPDIEGAVPAWDICPKNWTGIKNYYDLDTFAFAEGTSGTGIYERYETLKSGLDKMLAEHGLQRTGGYYHVTGSHDKTIALFCHFGATCVVISHLLGISPIVTLQGFSAEPTAIATLCTDDRFGADVNFRIHGFGDIHHIGGGIGSVNYK